MISADTLALLRGPQPPARPLSVFETDGEGRHTATADAFVHVLGGAYDALCKGRVIGRIHMERQDHGALSDATGLPVHSAIDWSRMEGWAYAPA